MKTEFPEMYLVTDTKADNKQLLSLIATEFPEMKDRIIPQVYHQDEYFYAKELGFQNIIYTLYLSEDNDEQVYDFCYNNEVFAITMPISRVNYASLAQDLKDIGVYVYTHTVNDTETWEEMKAKGVMRYLYRQFI